MSDLRFESAVVIGGSIAGLLAASALAEHFEVVTVIDKDCSLVMQRPARECRRQGTSTYFSRVGSWHWSAGFLICARS